MTVVSTLPPLAAYALALGDDALIVAQRLGEWVSYAPQMEEDIALANIGLDLLGQARTLLTYAGAVEGGGRDEDDLAYLRDDRDFRNVQLVEIPNGDFAVTMARQFVFSAYQYELYTALLVSADPTLAGLAGKAVKEVDYHRDHATQWVLRLGDGTELSRARMQAGLDQVWPYTGELFDPAETTSRAGRRGRPGRAPAGLGALRGHGAGRGDAAAAGAALALPRRPGRAAHRAPRAPAGRDAAPASLASRGVVVRAQAAEDAPRCWRPPGPCPTRRYPC